MAFIPERLTKLREGKGWSQADLAEQLGVSQSTVSFYESGKKSPGYATLEKITRLFGVSTDYLLGRTDERKPGKAPEPYLPPGAQPAGLLVKIPVYGEIAAGKPLLAHEDIIDWQLVSTDEITGGDYFFLQVRGDSMIGDGIRPGSRVLVRKQETVENGAIAVVIVNGEEGTLKRVYRADDKIVLQPSNPALQPVFVDARDVLVVGKVVSVTLNFE
jgi:repressor LexA